MQNDIDSKLEASPRKRALRQLIIRYQPSIAPIKSPVSCIFVLVVPARRWEVSGTQIIVSRHAEKEGAHLKEKNLDHFLIHERKINRLRATFSHRAPPAEVEFPI